MRISPEIQLKIIDAIFSPLQKRERIVELSEREFKMLLDSGAIKIDTKTKKPKIIDMEKVKEMTYVKKSSPKRSNK